MKYKYLIIYELFMNNIQSTISSDNTFIYTHIESREVLSLSDVKKAYPDLYSRASYEFDKIIQYLKNWQTSFVTNNPDVIFFGDSVITATCEHDQERIAIDKLLHSHMNHRMLSLTCGAFSPLIYKNIFSIIPKITSTHTTYCVIELNMRSFSDEWYIRPAYFFRHIQAACNYIKEGEQSYLKHFADYFNEKYTDLPKQELEKYYHTISKTAIISKFNTVIDILHSFKKNSSSAYKFYYCYEFPLIQERITTLIDCIEILKMNNISVLVYTTPINIDKFKKTTYSHFFYKNLQYINEYIPRYCEFLDLSISLSNSFFSSVEHLHTDGRRYVATRIADKLKEFDVITQIENPQIVTFRRPILTATTPDQAKTQALFSVQDKCEHPYGGNRYGHSV